MIEISPEFLASVLGTSPGEITNALKEGEAFKPQAEIEEYVKKNIDDLLIKAKNSGKSEGKKWGEKDSLTAKEIALKAKFGVEGANLDEIVDAAVEAAKQHSKLNPDDVKNSEVYINDTKKLKALLADKEKEVTDKVAAFEKAETMRLAKDVGLRLLKEKNFVLPENDTIREKHIANLFKDLEDAETVIGNENGKLRVLDSKGRVKENQTGTKELAFEDHFVEVAKSFFTQAVADNRQSPANKNAGDKSANTNPDMPEMKNTEDLMKAINAEKDVTKQKAIKEHYNKLVEDGAIT